MLYLLIYSNQHQAIRNYLNNHRYAGLTPEEVDSIKKKEEAASDREIVLVISYIHPESVKFLANADEGSGIFATKMARAAREIFKNLDEERKSGVIKMIEKWREDGYPAALQDK